MTFYTAGKAQNKTKIHKSDFLWHKYFQTNTLSKILQYHLEGIDVICPATLHEDLSVYDFTIKHHINLLNANQIIPLHVIPPAGYLQGIYINSHLHWCPAGDPFHWLFSIANQMASKWKQKTKQFYKCFSSIGKRIFRSISKTNETRIWNVL